MQLSNRFFVLRRLTKISRRFCSGASSSASKACLPLEGIKVLDLSRVLAGPFCSQVLGDFGAEIIKIENPLTGGDETRSWGPPFTPNSKQSAYYLSCNRNKKSITVNIKSQKGQEILHKLSSECDVLLENFLPDSLCKYNMDFDYIHENINKSLIYCSITGFGSIDGPYKYRSGYDMVIQAIGGMMHITGTPEDPCKTGVALIDKITGLYASNAILAALMSREKDSNKLGQKIDVNLFDSCIASLINIGSNYLIGGKEAQRWGTAHANVVPYQSFKTKNDDEHIVIGIGNDRQFMILLREMELHSMMDNDENARKYGSNEKRNVNRKELIDILSQRFEMNTLSEWLDIFDGSGIPYAPINNMQRLFENEHVLNERGLVHDVEHPMDGNIKIVGLPIKFSKDTEINKIKKYPPMLGEHNEEIICDWLGFDESYIDTKTL